MGTDDDDDDDDDDDKIKADGTDRKQIRLSIKCS